MMTPVLRIATVVVFSVGLLGGALLIGQSAKPSGARMAEAAESLIAKLTKEEKAQALFTFDDPHRTTWYFTPMQEKRLPIRKGLRLENLSDEKQAAVLELLKCGLSKTGYEQATTIMSLEGLLRELEGPNGAMVRNPGWYFVSIFGEPSKTGTWGWRIEGHHLSVNVTIAKGEVISASPLLFGANPAEVKSGDKKGLRTLPEIEDLAKELIASLNDDQTKLAKQAKQYSEVKEKQPNADVGEPVGIPAGKLTAAQQKTLAQLVEAYANRLPGDIASTELKRYQEADTDAIHFGYCIEADKPGKPYTYRIQGPTFVIEFLNTQADGSNNPANHIHSAWRALPNDFGLKGTTR